MSHPSSFTPQLFHFLDRVRTPLYCVLVVKVIHKARELNYINTDTYVKDFFKLISLFLYFPKRLTEVYPLMYLKPRQCPRLFETHRQACLRKAWRSASRSCDFVTCSYEHPYLSQPIKEFLIDYGIRNRYIASQQACRFYAFLDFFPEHVESACRAHFVYENGDSDKSRLQSSRWLRLVRIFYEDGWDTPYRLN
jgi:hypothetical protein